MVRIKPAEVNGVISLKEITLSFAEQFLLTSIFIVECYLNILGSSSMCPYLVAMSFFLQPSLWILVSCLSVCGFPVELSSCITLAVRTV